MRYSVHPSRAFRNRIAKSIGVLVAAALVATLGLPSVAQAQDITTVEFADMTGFTVTWAQNPRTTAPEDWIVTFTKPNGDKEVLNENSTGQSTLDLPATTSIMFNQKDEGTWWIQVAGCYSELPAAPDDVCPAADLAAGDSVGYTHGPPAAPKNLTASMVPGGVALTWTVVEDDYGYGDPAYQVRQDDGEEEGDWGMASATGAMVVKVDPGEYTFMVRAVGSSDNSTATAETAAVPGAAASVEITVPMPTPTLPEIAALLLAMLLLGSGAYLLRRRQSGGLTPA